MVALTFLFGVCSAGAMSIPGVLLTPISNDLGWSIGELSGPLGLRMTLFGLVAPFAGGLILLHGPRKVLTWSAILLIAGLARRHHDDVEMATLDCSRHRHGRRARHDSTRDGHDDRHTLVHRPAWPGAGHPQRRKCDRAVDLPDAGDLDRADLWMADGAGALGVHARSSGAAGRVARDRSAGGYRARALRRGHRVARTAATDGQCVRHQHQRTADGVAARWCSGCWPSPFSCAACQASV